MIIAKAIIAVDYSAGLLVFGLIIGLALIQGIVLGILEYVAIKRARKRREESARRRHPFAPTERG